MCHVRKSLLLPAATSWQMHSPCSISHCALSTMLHAHEADWTVIWCFWFYTRCIHTATLCIGVTGLLDVQLQA